MFKIVWDKPNNGICLTMSSAGEALNIPPRPVFFEELNTLGLNILPEGKAWTYPECDEPLLWACDRRYYYHGELVLEVSGGNVYEKPNLNLYPNGEALNLQPVNMDILRELNEETLFLIEHEAMEFINYSYRRYKGLKKVNQKNPDIDFQKLADKREKVTKEKHVVIQEDCDSFDIMPLSQAEILGKETILNNKIDKFIASFSGGKDSQVLLDLVARVIPSNDFTVIYSNTGYELPTSLELYKEVKEFYHKQYPDLEFLLSTNHQPVLYYWDQMGSPSNIHRWCCSVMKTAPLYKKLKEEFGKGKQPHVLSYIGTRGDESLKRSSYSRIAKDAKHPNVVNVSPIFDWNISEVWLYILFNNLPFNKAYRYGLTRVGCIVCPYGSDWNDHFCNKLFPDTARPFLEKITYFVERSGVDDSFAYIKTGNWKIRAGGSGYESKSGINIISQDPDFKALLTKPQENILEWLKVLGQYKYTIADNCVTGILKYGKQIFNLSLTTDASNNTILVEVPNVNGEIFFISHLKKILNKTVFCVHCEVCEVECPTGALSVVPIVRVNEKKCINCRKCIDFKDNGCVTANSIKKSEGIKMESKKSKKTTINRYNNFGFREKWLSFYLNHLDSYFDNEEHGLNIANQIPPFINWLRDSEILENNTKKPTVIGKLFAEKYSSHQRTIWELIWINLVYNSEICSWYCEVIEFGRQYFKDEIEKLLEDTLPQYGGSVRKNALGSLQNAFVTSPLGKDLRVGNISKINNKPIFLRAPNSDVSIATVAYSLYKYAEKQGRYSLTVSELYLDNQTNGIYREFGIERNILERILRTLQEDNNHILTVELNMGLDNINLREDLNSIDIITAML